jgi:hypothetical protein
MQPHKPDAHLPATYTPDVHTTDVQTVAVYKPATYTQPHIPDVCITGAYTSRQMLYATRSLANTNEHKHAG